MKLTKENVLKIQHQLISSCCIWERTEDDKGADKIAMYICGINDMAQEIMDAIDEIRRG